MNYRRLLELKEAEQHFSKYDTKIIFVMPNGAKLCDSLKEAKEYYKDRCKELKKEGKSKKKLDKL